jgi:hypothetical protein
MIAGRLRPGRFEIMHPSGFRLILPIVLLLGAATVPGRGAEPHPWVTLTNCQ